ncbi:amidase [Fulvivirgaceae bacterium BMA10]|uniref:Amidase n=1 Tax=Splendidivirga corallicola TaxID=3051826 RepID=A0ABT8KQ88_9BACT|nr:amidase [Fulvivirgaceae bacterium BMA10]
MKRKKFLSSFAIIGVFHILVLSSSCSNQSSVSQENSKEEHVTFALEELTVAQLQEGMASGKYTAKSIAQLYLDRIAAIDQNGPKLNSVIELNPDALSIADQLDQERKEGKVRGPLHGIPVLIKDNIDTSDKMTTTAGTLVLQGSIAPQDSYVVQKLREAGAIILGKTNLSEWANFRSTRSSSGWSGRGGQTRNPYILNRNPCGSSSGSGAAVSANLCAIAIGTETNGSIVCPSSSNGVVGIKPTVGLVGRSGIIPISITQDTAGPMARTVSDAATLLGALTGIDPRDDRTLESEGKSFTDYTQFLDKDGLKGARIGIGRNFMGFHEKVDTLMEKAILAMKNAGATIIDLDEVTPNGMGRAGFDVLLYEFKDGVNKYLASLGPNAPVKTLKEVIEYNENNRDKSMPFFEQEILVMAEEKGDLNDEEYKKALDTILRLSREEGIDKVMDEHQLDAIIGPTGGPAWPIDVINGDHFGGGSSSPAARAGYPNITVPAGFINGLPVGISFFGRAYSEPTLIKLAFAYEQLTEHRRAPEFQEHIAF